MPVPKNTLEGAQQHIEMLPSRSLLRLELEHTMEGLKKNTGLRARVVQQYCEEICRAAIEATLACRDQGIEASNMQRAIQRRSTTK